MKDYGSGFYSLKATCFHCICDRCSGLNMYSNKCSYGSIGKCHLVSVLAVSAGSAAHSFLAKLHGFS